jgi:hypothetical protein
MPLPNDRTGPAGGTGPAPDTLAVGASGVAVSLEQPSDNEIARGSAGDCCILCGKVGIDLPLDHGCKPNIDVEAYRAQPKRVAEFLDGRWDR